jgi:hypothetical protein
MNDDATFKAMKAIKAVRLAPVLLAAVLLLTAGARRNNAPAAGTATNQVVDAPAAKFDPKDPGYTNWCLEWSSNIYVGGYQRAGQKDAKWNEPALRALEAYAYAEVFHRPLPGKSPEYYAEQVKEALSAGCTDPLIRHLGTCLGRAAESANREIATEYGKEADEVEKSLYPSQVKFQLALQAGLAFRAASSAQLPEVNAYRRQASRHILALLRHEEIPALQASEDVMETEKAFRPNSGTHLSFYTNAEPILTTRWPAGGIAYLFRARQHLELATTARGGGFADTVTAEGAKEFVEQLDEAEQALNKAWELDPSLPKTPLVFMDVELYQGQGRARLELWFERALAFPQDEADAVEIKLFYLDPRWHGSEAICLAYARQVVRSDKFTGPTPLCLNRVHELLAGLYRNSRPNYWLEPQVWPDVKASFERYLQANSADDFTRNRYISAALRCHQWQAASDQIALLNKIDYDYFGGQAAFESMKQNAADKAAKGL